MVLLLQATTQPLPFDDALITFRYARNIAAGIGFVYNQGQPVLGTTTPLFAGILSVVALLWGPQAIPVGSLVVATAADCVSAWLIFRLARRAFADDGAGLLCSIAFALSPFRLSVATGGMEASFFTALLLLAFERLVLARDLAWGALSAGLALLTRPDALVALAPMLIYLSLRDRPFALRASALTALLVLPWIAWATVTFGSPLPNSVAAKATAYQYSPGFAAYFILGFLGTGTLAQFPFTPGLLAASLVSLSVVLIGAFMLARSQPDFIPLVTYPPLFLTLMALTNAPMFFPWYYYPILPGLVLAAASFIWHLPLSSAPVRRGILALTIVFALLTPAYLMQFSPSWPLSREREQAYHEACQFLQSAARPGDVVLAPDIGVIGWCLPQIEILDPIGLVSPAAIPYLAGRPQGPAIPEALVAETSPDYIVALEQYVTPFLASSDAFAATYRLAWSKPVTIAGLAQQLTIHRLGVPGP